MSTNIISRGRALSSLGQFYGFKRDSRAVHYFKEALKEFATDEGNRHITISHIMNYASDRGDRELYEKYAPIYFYGANNIYDQLAYLEEKTMGKDFALYTYMKALNLLYIDELEDDLIENIILIDFKKLGYRTNNHPWQLIYKNIGMILYKKNNPKLAIKYMDKGLEAIPYASGTIMAINHFTNIQKGFYTGDNNILKKTIENFKLWLEDQPIIKKHFIDSLSGDLEKTYNNLYEKFTFTYI